MIPRLRPIWHYRWWLLLAGLVAAGAAYGASKAMTPTYEGVSLVRIIPSQAKVGAGINETALQQIATSYGEVARSASVTNRAERKLGARPGTLGERAVRLQTGGILEVSVRNSKAPVAARNANALADAVVDGVAETVTSDRQSTIDEINRRVREIQAELSRRDLSPAGKRALEPELQQLQIRAADARTFPRDSARVIEPASVPGTPVSPRPLVNAVLAFVAMLLAGAGLVYLAFLISNRYESAVEVAEDLDLPILGELPKAAAEDQNAVEAFRALRTNLHFAVTARGQDGGGTQRDPTNGGPVVSPRADGTAPVVVVTSPEEGSGKTYVSTNTARALAVDGHRVVAVDADLRRPALHQSYGLPLEPGMTNALANGAAHTDSVSVKPVTLPRSASIRGGELRAVTAGAPADDSTELVATERMAGVVDELVRAHDYVIIDTPPVLAIADAVVLSRYADGVVLVVDARRSHRRTARRAVHALRSVGAPIVGVVFNRVAHDQADYYGYGYGYTAREPAPEAAETASPPERAGGA